MIKKTFIFLIFLLALSLVSASPYSSNLLSSNPYSSNTNIISTLKGLSDTNLENSLDMQTLAYNASSGLWYNTYLNNSGHSVNNSLYWDGHLYNDEGHWGISGSDIFYNAGNVGIGTTSPTTQFEIQQLQDSEGLLIRGFDNEDDHTMEFYVSQVGTATINVLESPFDRLKILGNNLQLDGTSPSFETFNDANAGLVLRTGSGGASFFGFEGGDFSIRNMKGGVGTDDIFRIEDGTPSGVLTLTSDGYVGINTTNPSSLLHIAGVPGNLSNGLTFGDGDTGFYESVNDELRIVLGGVDSWQMTGSFMGSPFNGQPTLLKENAGANNPNILPDKNDVDSGLGAFSMDGLSLISGGVEQLRLIQNDTSQDVAYFTGKVGIGKLSPTAVLEVESVNDNLLTLHSTDNFARFKLSDASDLVEMLLNGGASRLSFAGVSDYTFAGNVGIGTTTPNAPLTVSHSAPAIQFVDTAEQDWTITINSDDMMFAEGLYGSAPTTRLILETGGNVGIGTTTPQNKLNVIGDINATNKGFFKEFLSVGEPCVASLQGDGNLCVSGIITANNTFFNFATPNGLGMSSSSSLQSVGGVIPHPNLTATLDLNNNIFCDTENPFTESTEKKDFFIFFSTPDLANTVIITEDFINSSCMEINPINFGTLTGVFTNVIYVESAKPIFYTTDNGGIFMNTGELPGAIFQVDTQNGTSEHSIEFKSKSGIDNYGTQHIQTDTKGFNAGHNLELSLFSSVANSFGNVFGILMSADSTNVDNGTYTGITMDLTGQRNENIIGIALEISPAFSKIINVGSTDVLGVAWYDDGTTTFNITENATSPSIDADLFETDDSIVYIAGENEINFTKISVSILTGASQSINPIYYYCDSSHTWQTFSVNADTTNGWKNSGTVSFTNPIDRGNCNQEIDGTPFADSTNHSYIAIQRTRNVISPNVVTIGILEISGGGVNMVLQKDMLKLNPVSFPPENCSTNLEAALYWDDDLGLPCWCSGVNWVQGNDFTTVCT